MVIFMSITLGYFVCLLAFEMVALLIIEFIKYNSSDDILAWLGLALCVMPSNKLL